MSGIEKCGLQLFMLFSAKTLGFQYCGANSDQPAVHYNSLQHH